MTEKKDSQVGLQSVIIMVIALVAFAILGYTVINRTSANQEKIIIRIGHNQSSDHPTHVGMEAFEEYIEEEFDEKYDVQLFPSELLGSQTNMVQLTQTGAVDITVASNAILEAFNPDFQIFNLPYLFEDPEVYHAVMNDPEIVGPIFNGTYESGFVAKAWLDAGTRNFYVEGGPIETLEDFEGLKIRVQQSPTNVRMMQLLGGSATPMGFGEVYTAIQAGIIDGAENNELALTENGHGDIVKHYSYTLHQMIPDEVIVSTTFLESLPEEDKAIFDKGFELMQDTQHAAWAIQVEEARDRAENEMGVSFTYPDVSIFSEAVLPLHEEVTSQDASLKKRYDEIQRKIAELKGKDDTNEES